MTTSEEFEKNIALREAHQIHDSNEYFNARPQISGSDRRKVFEAGYTRAWQACDELNKARIAELEELLKDRESDLEHEFKDNARLDLENKTLRDLLDDATGSDWWSKKSAVIAQDLVSKALSAEITYEHLDAYCESRK